MSTELETDLGLDPERQWDLSRLFAGSLGICVFVAVWWVATLFNPSYVLPAPDVVARTFLVEVQTGAMLTALVQSITHWLPGTIVGTTLGITLGVTLAWSDTADDLAAPLVRVLRPVPPLALIGFAIAWIGINDAGAAFIIAAGAFWINYYAAYGGVDSVSEEFLDVGRSLGISSDIGLIRKVVLPAASPEIITGIRTGIGRCWMLIIAAEIFGVPGIGQRILTASNNLAVDVVIAYILLMSLVYLLLDVSVETIQRRALVWR